MSRDDFTKNRLMWLEQVAEDPRLSAAAKSIAIKLCTKYFNRIRNGDAWPSVETLALDTKTCLRTARAALRALAKYRHMTIHEGGGRHRTNHYDMLINPAADCPL